MCDSLSSDERRSKERKLVEVTNPELLTSFDTMSRRMEVTNNCCVVLLLVGIAGLVVIIPWAHNQESHVREIVMILGEVLYMPFFLFSALFLKLWGDLPKNVQEKEIDKIISTMPPCCK